MGWAPLTGQALASIEETAVIKQILAHLERKAESKEFNPLPESRAPPHQQQAILDVSAEISQVTDAPGLDCVVILFLYWVE